MRTKKKEAMLPAKATLTHFGVTEKMLRQYKGQGFTHLALCAMLGELKMRYAIFFAEPRDEYKWVKQVKKGSRAQPEVGSCIGKTAYLRRFPIKTRERVFYEIASLLKL